jgi:hypothetical protein
MSKRDWGQSQPHVSHDVFRLFAANTTGGHTIENDDGRRVAGNAQQLHRRRDCFEVIDRRLTWNKNQVGRLGGYKQGLFDARRGVDHNEIGPLILGSFENLRQTGCLGTRHHWAVVASAVAPPGGRHLLVEVHDQNRLPGLLRRHGKGKSQRSFARAALLADDR